jgi:DNA-binding response OmpR family regulator
MPLKSPASAPVRRRVLVLESDQQLTGDIGSALREAAPDVDISVARTLEEAQRAVVHARPDLFVFDLDAIGRGGQEFLYDLRTSHPQARAIILTGASFAAQREQTGALGAVHFLEKPFPHGDFVTLAEALLAPAGEGEKFQGTLSDLHIADIIQLKCISGATSVLEFTGPAGEKARVFFEAGQVRHAIAPGKEGIAAFNEIVNWPGGKISEVAGAGPAPRTIDLDWQVLLMEAVRRIDETRRQTPQANEPPPASRARKVLVIDDSLMLLSFVKEILTEANYEVAGAATAEEGIALAEREQPDLILLDYVLPDRRGDAVARELAARPSTARSRILYMSGFGSDLEPGAELGANVIGSLNKPFTSDLLTRTVAQFMPEQTNTPENERLPTPPAETSDIAAAAGGTTEPWWSAPVETPGAWPDAASTPGEEVAPMPAGEEISEAPKMPEPAAEPAPAEVAPEPAPVSTPPPVATPAVSEIEPLPVTGDTFFCGDTSFFSLHWALNTVGQRQLTGVLRFFWENAAMELFARNGHILLVTTRNPELYCPEAPITLVNVDAAQTETARAQQRESGCPMFLTLAQHGLILREPALQLVQHYGQKLFAQLWTAQRVRFAFELNNDLPPFADEVGSGDDEIDQWLLSTLRFLQFQELPEDRDMAPQCIPAYTRDGFDRVQQLRLTVAEAQFASQFNGVRSVAQIAKNLRLDIKFARLTLFRFVALEIVECWPPAPATAPQKRGFFARLGGSIGLGE